MAVYFGSARIDERGRAAGGAAGDQKQKAKPDYSGEVSQEKFYVHSLGWYVLRAKSAIIAANLAGAMINACDNPNVGYDQNQRLGVVNNGTGSKVKTECDCSSLVRQCIKEATNGTDPGNFTTANEATKVMATGLFDKITYTSGMTLYTGDILVTRSKGHTGIITSGAPRVLQSVNKYYPAYSGNTVSIVTALKAVGESDTSYTHRKKIAAANNIGGYSGTAMQNTQMLNLLKLGQLVKA